MKKRKCRVCGVQLNPFVYKGRQIPMTAHEFNCYRKYPEMVPKHLQKRFEKTLAWSKRHFTRLSNVSKHRKR